MKKFYFLILLPLLLCVAAGCGKDKDRIDEPDEPDKPEVPAEVTLELSGADLVFEVEGGQKTFTITCNAGWTITNESDWCTTDVTAGTGNRTVTVKAQTYDNALEDRNMNLIVKAGGKAKVLTVTQKHGNAIVPYKAKFEVAQGGGDLAIRVRSNVTYEVTIPDACSSWIQPAPETRAEVSDTTYRFIIAENETDDSRTGYIIFSAASLSDTVRIFQAQKDRLVLTQTEYKLFGEDTTIMVELKTNVDYEVSILGDAASWVSRVETRACRVDRLQFHIEENTGDMPREGKIVFQDKNSDLADTLFVKQFAKDTYRGDIIFQTKQDLIDFRMAGNTVILGNVIVQGTGLKNLRELGNLLLEIDGDLTLECDALESLEGLGGLKRITGNLVITEGTMTTLGGLENLESIGGNFKIDAGYSSIRKLISFAGFTKLRSIGGNFELDFSYYSSNALESFDGLDNLESIGGSFKVIFKYFSSSIPLKSFSGLSKLKSIGGDFEVGFYAGGYYREESLDSLESFVGLDNLKSIGGNFKVIGRNSLNSLKSFTGLNNLENIDGNFEVSALSKDRVYNSIDFSLRSLESFEGLNKLKRIGGNFKVYSCASEYDANSLPSLSSFEGLENLESIGGSFEVVAVAGRYTRGALNSLKSFVGLGMLKSVQNISITGCWKLYNFCALKEVVESSGCGFTTSGNGYNPTKDALLNGNCSGK